MIKIGQVYVVLQNVCAMEKISNNNYTVYTAGLVLTSVTKQDADQIFDYFSMPRI